MIPSHARFSRLGLLASPPGLIGLMLALFAVHTAAQTTWEQRLPAFHPGDRSGNGLCFDPSSGRTVLFGGQSGLQKLNDTWQWDGTDWTQLTPATAPPPRAASGMAYDVGRGRLVVFGGYGGVTGFLGDTWEWDGTDWQQRFSAHAPAARGNAGMVYENARGKVLLFGGELQPPVPPWLFVNDTWQWDGTDWTQLTPASAPPPRAACGMVYDHGRGRTVLFGGFAGSRKNDTWEWDGANWQQSFPVHVPERRNSHGMAYDGARQRVVMFGGVPDWVGTLRDTWEYDGTDWAQTAPPVSPPGYMPMTYDPVRGRVVLSTGYSTWEYYLDPSLATYGLFGAGCAGMVGMPQLTANGHRPILGQAFTVSLSNLPPDHSTLFVLGLSNTNWLGSGLPLELGALGAPGCNLLVSPDATYPLFNWAGYATWSFPIPSQPSLTGLAFYNQAAAIDHSNALGLVFTNGGAGVIGDH